MTVANTVTDISRATFHDLTNVAYEGGMSPGGWSKKEESRGLRCQCVRSSISLDLVGCAQVRFTAELLPFVGEPPIVSQGSGERSRCTGTDRRIES